mgnify:CR=1 FL=1
MSLFDKVNGQQMNMEQLRRDPVGAARQAGYNIPDNLAGNPQAMVQHLIQTGQISNPMLQRIMPMIQRMGK